MLNGQQHENIEAIRAAVMMELIAVLKEAFSSCFQICRNIGNSVVTAERTTLKGTGTIS
jgi:hypothetical protein